MIKLPLLRSAKEGKPCGKYASSTRHHVQRRQSSPNRHTRPKNSSHHEQVRHKLNNRRPRRKTSRHHNNPRHSDKTGGTVFGTESLDSKTNHDQPTSDYKRISHHRGSRQIHGKKKRQNAASHGQQ